MQENSSLLFTSHQAVKLESNVEFRSILVYFWWFYNILFLFLWYLELKSGVLEGINDLLEELDGLYQTISNQALEHIHSKSV